MILFGGSFIQVLGLFRLKWFKNRKQKWRKHSSSSPIFQLLAANPNYEIRIIRIIGYEISDSPIISSPFPNHRMQQYCGLSLLMCASPIDIDNVDPFVHILRIPWNSWASVKYDEKLYHCSFFHEVDENVTEYYT
jgi:hypothetical protein